MAILIPSIALAADAPAADELPTVSVLFLGDDGQHQPRDRAAQLRPALARRGIDVTYTEKLDALTPETLADFDALLIYANIEKIEPAQERALLDYVADGGGLVAVHSASYCFLNSPKYVELVGGQFHKHGTGTFHTRIAEPDHPIMRGFGGFASWDETYVHHRHNEKDRTVLSYRVDEHGREPWTWVRTQGKGRVFYTAWGHDGRTWGHAGFQNLIERGIRWAAGGDPGVVPAYQDAALTAWPAPEMTPQRTDVKPFEFVDVGAKIPNYAAGEKWGAQDEPLSRMQKPLPPEESVKHFVTPVGFEMQLFASEPDLGGKPIAMAWDERGRLWVAETYDYPNELQRPGRGRDRIRICEDTDGDGRADKFTVFAEGLSIPTSIAFHRGGAIVQDGTRTVYLKDTDGDDRADRRDVLISGWALGDTHGGVSNFQYGVDNWIWAMQGYNNSAPIVQGRKQQAFRMGFFRFRPDGSELEFIRSTDNNTWGLGISEEGLIFGSTANRNPSVFMPIANRYYERVRGWSPRQLGSIADTHLFDPVTDNVRQVDHHGGYTAGAGHALYTARRYPQAYWNRTAFVCGPTGHLVGTFVLRPDGAGFRSTSPCNLVASDDEWTAPIMAEVGPDGNLWILDWYNYIVQHNPTPQGFRTGRGNAYETDLRDKKHGRIYRLVVKGAEPSPPMTLAGATPEQLVEALGHPTMLWRKHAQRLLVERGRQDVVPALIALVDDRSVDAIGLNVGAIHALWTLDGLGALDGTDADALRAAVSALRHPSAGVRRNAVQVLPRSRESVGAILDTGLLADADAQVRLAALLALTDMPADGRAAAAVAELALRPEVTADRWIADALTSAAAMHAVGFLQSLAASDGASLPARGQTVARIVAEHIARGKPQPEQLNLVLQSLEKADLTLVEPVLSGLSGGWPDGHSITISPEAERAMVALLDRVGAGAKGQLIRLAPRWGSREVEKHADQVMAAQLKTIGDDGLPTKDRIQAARELVRFRPDSAKIVTGILDAVTPQAPPELATALVDSLAASTADDLGTELVQRSRTMTPATRAAALRVLLGRPETTMALLKAVEAGEAQLSDLTLDQKQALTEHPDRTIREQARELLERGGALPSPDRAEVLAELLPLAKRSGDAELGQAVFKKQCSKCHVHGGEGQRIGPDLTGMAAHSKSELLTHILDPSRSVEGNFRTYTVATSDGRIFSGMLAGESKTAIELIDTEAKRHAIQREDIEQLLASKKSLMPDGFEKQLPAEDLVNLLEYLTRRGRYTPLDLRKAATIVSTRGMFYDENSKVERLIFPDWTPKTVDGVPFLLVDPQGTRVPNVIMLHGPKGKFPPRMPKSVSLPVNQPAGAVHLLSGVGGWAAKGPLENGTTSMTVRLHYADGETEDHELQDGRHFADYIGLFDVPESKRAFDLGGRQVRYLAIHPRRSAAVERIEFIKGKDDTAPLVVAVTVEAPTSPADGKDPVSDGKSE